MPSSSRASGAPMQKWTPFPKRGACRAFRAAGRSRRGGEEFVPVRGAVVDHQPPGGQLDSPSVTCARRHPEKALGGRHEPEDLLHRRGYERGVLP